MFLHFYKLNEQPFGVTPDPRYLYLSASHSEALASIKYGVMANRGFTALIAHPGMGKTTLLFEFLSNISPSTTTVFLFQSYSTPRELLQSLLEDLEIPSTGKDVGQMQRELNGYLIRESNRGRRLVVIIDEAQNLDDSVLEGIRLLSNFESSREKLIHLILSGQPALAEKLNSPRLLQLKQRISIVARLKPFNFKETRMYVNHRLSVAGYASSQHLFTDAALTLIAQKSEGIPRNINNLCFNAMSLACATRVEIIDVVAVEEVLADLDLCPLFADDGAVASEGTAWQAANSVTPCGVEWYLSDDLPQTAISNLAEIDSIFLSKSAKADGARTQEFGSTSPAFSSEGRITCR
jgi:general secretion pathway protein A